MEKRFKLKISNEPKDEHLKMNLLYHVPMHYLPELIEYLEKIAPRKK